MNAKEYIKYLLSVESYSFSLEEISKSTKKNDVSLKFELARLIKKKEIVNLRKGYYLIIPPRYSGMGNLPVELYVDKLFDYLKRKYYLGLFSAAKFYGAGHQQSQRDYIITEKPKLNTVKKNGADIKFFTIANWPENNIVSKKSDAGTFKVSSPVLTALDLIHHQNKLGGMNRILTVVEELAEEIDAKDLPELLKWYPYKSTLQRFGFLMEKIGAEKTLINLVRNHLAREKYFPVLLSPKADRKAGAVDNIWKVDVNIKLESDL